MSTKTSARTTRLSKTNDPASGRNGTAPANAPAKPTTVPREPSDFVLRTAFREFAAEHPEQTDVNELTAAFIKTLTNAQIRLGLHQMVRSYLASKVMQHDRAQDWGFPSHQGKQPPTRSPRNETMRLAAEDGSLGEYRKIVDAEILVGGERRRFGSFTLLDLESAAEVREKLAKGHFREAGFLKRLHEQMRTTGARAVDDLDPRWLVNARHNA